MSSTLPVPITFKLPNDHWQPVEPESLGVTNAAFLAVRREHEGGGYAPTLTISGDLRSDPATLEEIADEAVTVLAEELTDVELVQRREYGTDQAPAVLQVLGGLLQAQGRTFDLRQAQVLMALNDVHQPEKRAVLKIVLSTTFAQFETYLPELQDFMRSLRPENATTEG